jgi:prepilin-type N-terminal cleavage/methylation domain-containing protein
MRNRHGFTLLEMVVTLMFGSVLAAVAYNSLGGVQARIAVRSAQSNFLSMHAHTRALAVERGAPMRLVADAGGQVVRIEVGCAGGGDVLESRDFASSYGVSVEMEGEILGLCMTPRGFALPASNTFGQEGRIEFVRGPHSSAVVLLPLGQAVVP